MSTSQLKQILLASTVTGKLYILKENLLDFNKIIPATSGDSKAHRLSYQLSDAHITAIQILAKFEY
jgi:hypothetical protein